MSAWLLYLVVIALTVYSGCTTIKDIPEAEVSQFTLISKHTGYRGSQPLYSYRWYDKENKITYEVYSYEDYHLKIGTTMAGLIRK